MEENKKQEEGICPVCGEELEYGTGSADGSTYGYDWECKHCGAQGVEVYDMTFTEHVINYDPRKKE